MSKECRFMEFFEDDKGQNSMSSLLLLGTFVTSALIMLALTYQEKMSEGYLTIFLTAFVVNMAVKKTAEVKTMQATNASPP